MTEHTKECEEAWEALNEAREARIKAWQELEAWEDARSNCPRCEELFE